MLIYVDNVLEATLSVLLVTFMCQLYFHCGS